MNIRTLRNLNTEALAERCAYYTQVVCVAAAVRIRVWSSGVRAKKGPFDMLLVELYPNPKPLNTKPETPSPKPETRNPAKDLMTGGLL